MNHATVQKALGDIRELTGRRNAALSELERSFALQSLWPDVFAHGRAISCWIGAPLQRHWLRGYIVYALRMRVTNGAGEVREFLQDEVPKVLWPHTERGRLP